MRIYLDNCCYNRPFDDQSQLLVRLETEAKLAVQKQMRLGIVEYVWSDILDGEVEDNPDIEEQVKILPWRDTADVRVAVTPEIEERAEKFMRLGVKAADALHLACAVAAKCDWFLTTDKGILKKVADVGGMRVANPIAYIQETLQ